MSGRGNTILRRFFCFTVPKHSVKEPFCAVFQKNSGSEKVIGQEGGGGREGISRLSVENFLFNSTKKFRRGNFLFFRKIRVSKNFMPKRGTSRFCIENFLSHSAENFVGQPFSVSLIWGIEKC